MAQKKQAIHPFKEAAKQTFNDAWKLLNKKKLNKEEKITLLNLVHTSFYLWQQIPECNATNISISLWQISRAYAHIGDGLNALLFAEQNIKLSKENNLDGFYIAYAHESAARANIISKNNIKASTQINSALKAIRTSNEEHSEILLSDINSLKNLL